MEEHDGLIPSGRHSAATSSHSSRWAAETSNSARISEAPSIPMSVISSAYEPLYETTAPDAEANASAEGERPSPNEHESIQNGQTGSSSASTPPAVPEKPAAYVAVDQRHRQGLMRTWWRELLACALFLAALLGLFATLFAYFDKPSPKWPSWISLNTIVAIYIVLLKTGILVVTAEGLGQLKWLWLAEAKRPLDDLVKYDDATRGPFGALELLWRLGVRSLLPSFGALLIILCLALDPFAQQIIHYDNCSVSASLPARASKTNYYSDPSYYTIDQHQTTSVPMRRAALAGIFSSVAPPAVQCPTGNCTWGPYSTVGWRHTCIDLTDQLKFSNVSFEVNIYNETVTQYNYTTALPRGGLSVAMNPLSDENPSQAYCAMGPAPTDLVVNVPANWPASIDFVLGKSVWGAINESFQVTGDYVPMNPTTLRPVQGCNTTEANATWPCRGYGASRCSMFHCVKTFNASMSNGRWEETLLHTSSDWGHDSFSTYTNQIIDSACLSADDRRELAMEGFNITDEPRWQGLNLTIQNSWSNTTANYTRMYSLLERFVDKGCLYMADSGVLNNFAVWMQEQFTGVVYGDSVRSRSSVGQFTGSDTVQAVFDFGEVTFEHVDRLLANVTESLTNFTRQNSYNVSRDALGMTFETKTCVSVRWQFLAYPTALALLALAFFVLMLSATRPSRGSPEIWKSSPLALLYHGLAKDHDDSSALHPSNEPYLENIRSMRKIAEA